MGILLVVNNPMIVFIIIEIFFRVVGLEAQQTVYLEVLEWTEVVNLED